MNEAKQPGLGARRLWALLTAALALLSAGARASEASYYMMAPVLSKEPIITLQEVERPVQHCTEYAPEQHSRRHESRQRHNRREPDRHLGSSLIGGLLGGLVGNQFGGGSGRKVLTVVGALAGSSIARGIARDRQRSRSYSEPVRSCHTTYEYDTVERIDGYEVVYAYAGQEFSKIVAEDPGEQVRVRVSLAPVEGG